MDFMKAITNYSYWSSRIKNCEPTEENWKIWRIKTSEEWGLDLEVLDMYEPADFDKTELTDSVVTTCKTRAFEEMILLSRILSEKLDMNQPFEIVIQHNPKEPIMHLKYSVTKDVARRYNLLTEE